MKNLILTTIATTLIATTAFAANSDMADKRHHKPHKCPTVEAIQAAGFQATTDDVDNSLYVSSQESKFDTKFNWGFVMLIPYGSATDVNDAATKAAAELASLTSLSERPTYNNGQFTCDYSNADGYTSVAVTPVADIHAMARRAALK